MSFVLPIPAALFHCSPQNSRQSVGFFIELGQQRVEGVILEYHNIFVGGLAPRIHDRWDQQVGVAHLTARDFLSLLVKR
jgi:hypothetical protein